MCTLSLVVIIHRLLHSPIIRLIIGLLFLLFANHPVNAGSSVWHKSNGTDAFTQEIRISPSQPNIIYATIRTSTGSGLLKSIDRGVNFTIVFPITSGRDVNSIAISGVNANLIWIGTYEQGIFKSNDGGLTWTASVGIVPKKTRFVTVDPQNDNILYAGTGSTNGNGGIYKSINGGNTWTQIGTSTFGNRNSVIIEVDKHNSNIIYAGSDSGVFKSTDTGNTWSRLINLNTNLPATLVDKSSSSIVYTSVADQGIYKSVNAGLNWNLKNNNMGSSIIFRLAQDDNGNLFASRVNHSGGNVWKSTDNAESWENISNPDWGNSNARGLDSKNGRVFVNIEGRGIFYSDTYTPTSPVVIVPGFGASWSYKGIVENQPTTYEDWQLMPIFGEIYYQPLVQTLVNSGLTDHGSRQKVFTFAYDYRKSVIDSANSLNSYLSEQVQSKNPGVKANIVAHSMGGLVAGYCYKKIANCADKIDKIVTAGTPHQGTLEAYLLWEGGQINDKDLFRKTAELLALKSTSFPYLTTKDIIQNKFFGIRDLLPIFDYIDTRSYSAITQAKNPTLESISSIPIASLTTLSGNDKSTSANFSTKPLSRIDKILGLWADGKPNQFFNEIGDGTVLKKSSEVSYAINMYYPIEHKEYLRDQTVEADILNTLGITPKNIVTLNTQPHSVLIFVIHSPATIQTTNGFNPDGKSVFISDPITTSFNIKLTGTGDGNFQLDAFYSSDNLNLKRTINGFINNGESKNIVYEFAPDITQTFEADTSGESLSTRINSSRSQHLKEIWKRINRDLADFISGKKNKQIFATLEKSYPECIDMYSRSVIEERQSFAETCDQFLNFSAAVNQTYNGPVPSVQIVNEEIAQSQIVLKRKSESDDLEQRQAANIIRGEELLFEANQYLSLSRLYPAHLLALGARALAN